MSVVSFVARAGLLVGVLLALVVFLPAFAPIQALVLGVLAALWATTRLVLLGIGAAMLLAWLAVRWGTRQWVYPDEYGQLPYRKSVLKANPQLAIQASQTHQKTLQ